MLSQGTLGGDMSEMSSLTEVKIVAGVITGISQLRLWVKRAPVLYITHTKEVLDKALKAMQELNRGRKHRGREKGM